MTTKEEIFQPMRELQCLREILEAERKLRSQQRKSMEERAQIREEKLKDQIVTLESELKDVKKSTNLEISLIEQSNKVKLKRA